MTLLKKIFFIFFEASIGERIMLTFYLSLIETEEDKTKFEQLYTLYRNRMWYAAHEVLNNSFDAEDAVHNAFVGIAKNMSSIGDAQSKETLAYVVTAAKNCALNISQRSRHKGTVSLDDFRDLPDESAFERLKSIENKRELLAAVEALPDKYRDVLFLHYYSGLSEKEIASLLGIGYAAVRKQTARARAMLAKKLLKEDEAVESV